MIKLVKNELFKILHKKSTYITLIVLFAFLILTSVIYKALNNLDTILISSLSNTYDIRSLQEEIDTFDVNSGKMSDYAELKARFDIEKFSNDFMKDTWKVNRYTTDLADYVYEYYEKLYVNKDLDEAANIKKIIDTETKFLEENNWQHFVNKDLANINRIIDGLKSKESLSKEEEHNLKKYEYQKFLEQYRLEKNISYDNSYLNDAITSLYGLIDQKLTYENTTDEKVKEDLKSDYAEFMEEEYILLNEVDNNSTDNLRGLIKNFFLEYIFLIVVFVVLISGSIVSDEFNKGTIKSLLILPYSRVKILLSKFIAALLMIPLVTLVLLIFQLLIGGLIFGYESLSIPVIGYNIVTNSIESLNVFTFFLINFLGTLPKLVIIASLAFAASSIINSTAFSIVIGFFIYIGGNIINAIATSLHHPIFKYIITTNWDFTPFIFGGSSPYDVTLTHSIIVCLVYFLIIVLAAFIVFKRKDIKNI